MRQRRPAPGRSRSARSRPDRRRAARRDVLATLALAGAIFVSILSLPIGRVHAGACAAISGVAGRELPCGLAVLNVTIDTDRMPFLSVSWTPLRLRDMF